MAKLIPLLEPFSKATELLIMVDTPTVSSTYPLLRHFLKGLNVDSEDHMIDIVNGAISAALKHRIHVDENILSDDEFVTETQGIKP